MARINKLKLEVWSNENTSMGEVAQWPSLVAQWLRPHASIARAVGSIPAWLGNWDTAGCAEQVAINK